MKWLKHINNCQGRLGRRALALQGYNFEIIHKASSANGNADGLSCHVYHQVDSEKCDPTANDCELVCQVSDNQSGQNLTAVTLVYGHEQDHKPSVATATTSTETALKQNTNKVSDNSEDPTEENLDMILLQRGDKFYMDIIKYKLQKCLPEDPKQAKLVVAESDQFELSEHGILLHIYTPRTKVFPRTKKSSHRYVYLLYCAMMY